jgi:hypothetical protein
MAAGWGKESTYYEDVKRATGWGDFRNDGNVRALNVITVVDEADDGNNVYGVTKFFFRQHGCEADLSKESGTDCREDFFSKGSKTTPEFKNRTKTFSHSKDLTPTASRARAETFACVQMGWPVPDNCAPAAYPTFDY